MYYNACPDDDDREIWAVYDEYGDEVYGPTTEVRAQEEAARLNAERAAEEARRP